MDLNNLDFRNIEDEGTLMIKSKMTAWKEEYEEIRFKDLEARFNRYNPEKFVEGELGLYIQPFITYYGVRLWMFMLDVEHKSQHHKSVEVNIKTAQNLFYLFDALEIADDLVISLTGNGFRFETPCIIPVPYSDAFLEMVKDTERFPGIDPGPQSKEGFMRMAAYRGNRWQSNPQWDVHTHTLENPSEILHLDEKKYKALVAGKPDFRQSCEAFARMIPRGFAPKPLTDLLEDYNIKIKLRSTLGMPRAGKYRRNGAVDMSQILSFVEEAGITYIENELAEIVIYRLDTCPECGQSEGNPFINSQSGVLKCWRSNNCPAGQGGLRPHQWVENYSVEIIENNPDSLIMPDLTLAEARQVAEKAMEDAFESGENMVLNATMGVGKTHIAINHSVPRAIEKRVLYTVPTNELAEEITAKATQKAMELGLDADIRHIVGRNKENCMRMDNICLVAEKGYTPAYIVCVGCIFRKNCIYLEQFTNIPEKSMVVTTHDTAAFHKERIRPDIWIVDENAVNQFIGIYQASQKDMEELKELEVRDVKPLFDKVCELAFKAAMEIKDYGEARLYVKDTPPGQWENACTLENIQPEIKKFFDHNILPARFSLHHGRAPENEFQWEWAAYKEDLQLESVRFWDQVIYDYDDAIAYVKVTLIKGIPDIKYCVVKSNPPRLENCQVIHLDGTIYEPEIKALFPEGTKIVDARVRLDSCLKIFVKAARGKTRALTLEDSKMYEDMNYLLGFLRPEDKKVLLITHKAIEEKVLGIARNLLPEIMFESFHFWGPRGINSYRDFDACISYGTPTANPASVSDIAMMLFDDIETIDDWRNSLRERELAQAIHRIRPVNGGKNIIIMGSYWPVQYLGYPDQQFDRMRKGGNFDEAKHRLQQFAADYGFITKAAAMLINVATRQDGKELLQVRDALTRRAGNGGSDFVSTLINIYKSGDKINGGYPAIFLAGNNSWKKLMDDIHAETGLPYMLFCPDGRGRSSLALGSAEAAASFCEKFGTRFRSSEYKQHLPG